MFRMLWIVFQLEAQLTERVALLPKGSASLVSAVPSRSRCLPMATQSGHLIGIRCGAVLGVHVDGLRLGGRVSDAALL